MTTPLLTNEVARILGVTPASVRAMETSGRLAAVKTASGLRLFDPADVERLRREREAQGGKKR